MLPRHRYRLYIDESGDHNYSQLDRDGHRFLGLLGAWMSYGEPYAKFQDDLESFKRDIFGHPLDGDPVILHRKDIIDKSGRFFVLQDRESLVRFNSGLLKLIADAPFTMCCVVIDKKQHQNAYQVPEHPYHYCLIALLERYLGWLHLNHAEGDVMAESRGGNEDAKLKAAYRQFYECGGRFLKPEKVQRLLTSKELKLKPKSANIAGLQLADILAQPVKQKILHAQQLISVPSTGFGSELFGAAELKFNTRVDTGATQGYGFVIL